MKHSNIAFFIPHLGCPHTCSFCNQRSISGQTAPPDGETVRRTCETALAAVKDPAQTEIAFFGGSFTAIERTYMTELLKAAAPFCKEGRCAGIRISTRPDCISEEILDLLKRYAVTAVELGVQSMDDRVLALNERGHTAAQAEQACGMIRAYGFSLGLQMMTGLYGDSKESTYKTAERIIALCPDTVRIYPTVVLRGTRLFELYQQGLYHPPDTEETVPLVAELLERFERAGLRVIRVGLHASQEVERVMAAGAYHPAFRELCEGERCYRKMLERLKASGVRRAEIAVPPQMVSRYVGQSRRNVNRLHEQGYDVVIKQDKKVPMYDFEIRNVSNVTEIVGITRV